MMRCRWVPHPLRSKGWVGDDELGVGLRVRNSPNADHRDPTHRCAMDGAPPRFLWRLGRNSSVRVMSQESAKLALGVGRP